MGLECFVRLFLASNHAAINFLPFYIHNFLLALIFVMQSDLIFLCCAVFSFRRFMTNRFGNVAINSMNSRPAGVTSTKDGMFTQYTTREGLSHNFVRAVHQTADGTIWLGTYGGGLNRLKDGRFTTFTTRHGLFENVVSRSSKTGAATSG